MADQTKAELLATAEGVVDGEKAGLVAALVHIVDREILLDHTVECWEDFLPSIQAAIGSDFSAWLQATRAASRAVYETAVPAE